MDDAPDAKAPVKPGDVIAGKYRVEHILGVGGMGVVVAAQHLELYQRVAIKFVLPDSLQTAESVERFLREARAVVRLKSEHVAKVLDVGKLESGAPYIVMEYLEGADLGHVLEKAGVLPLEAAAGYVVQACEALAEAHSVGIVHRDLKPQNLFLTQGVGGRALVKVLDFGVSKITGGTALQGLTHTASVMGSPLYMSPEQMRSARNVDPRSDVWALGIVFYELLAGRTPFHAESIPELCLKVVGEAPRPISELVSGIPSEVEAIIQKCLEKDPDNRFRDSAELAEALGPFAPAMDRVTIEHARLVVSSMRAVGSTGTPPQRAAMVGGASGTGEARQTPRPWSGSSAHASSGKKSRAALFGAGGIGLVVAVSAAFLVLRGGSREDAHRAPPDVPPTAAPTLPPPPVVSLSVGPPPPVEGTRNPVDAPDASIAPGEPGTAAPQRPAVATSVAKPAGSPRPAPMKKPASLDDEIPSMR